MKKRMDNSHQIIELFVKAGLIAALAAALLAPLTINASGGTAGSASHRLQGLENMDLRIEAPRAASLHDVGMG